MSALLVLVTLGAFWGLLSNGFVHLDDDRYVTGNAHVAGGLTWENARWAFTTLYFGFYYPLTWLSHMTDVQLFGLWAGGHHLTSLFLHALNALLLFLLLVRTTGAQWRSALVAALFALHPLHVESVAWVACRKDVLSTFFWFLCLLAYAAYAERPSPARYTAVFLAFLLGLMAKSMLVTLPFTLLLLDYWPLGRWSPGGATRAAGPGRPATARRLLVEKLPLFALVPLFSVLTWMSQAQMAAVIPTGKITLVQRAANALISYGAYVWQTLVPVRMAVFYPHPRSAVSLGLAGLCGAALLAATAAALWLGRERKYLAVGWLWYVGTLVPVIGLVQVGDQARADRYTYVPLVGLFVAAVWGIAERVAESPQARRVAAAAAAVVLVTLGAATFVQVRCWRDSVTLFEHALAVTPPNPFLLTNLGASLCESGRKEEGIARLQAALRLDPSDADAHNNLGNALSDTGRASEAMEEYREAARLSPGAPQPLANLGLAYLRLGRFPEAIDSFQRAVAIDPGFTDVRLLLGATLLQTGKNEEAAAQFEKVLSTRPGSVPALGGLGRALAGAGQLPRALDLLGQALERAPSDAELRETFAITLGRSGRLPEAVEQFREILKLRPDSAGTWRNLGLALDGTGRTSEAIACFEKALELQPDFDQAREDLNRVKSLSRAGAATGR